MPLCFWMGRRSDRMGNRVRRVTRRLRPRGSESCHLHWLGLRYPLEWICGELEMQGQGVFYDPRLNDATTFPIAARIGSGNVRHSPDLVTAKLPNLHFYQLGIAAPKPPTNSFDLSSLRGARLFSAGSPTAQTVTYRLSSLSRVGICQLGRKSA